jgi:hypothetical protein
MNIREMNCNTGSITVTMRDTELRTLTNLLCRARKHIEFSADEYAINAKLFTAITVLHCGKIPKFERVHINELFEMADKKMDGKGDE